MPTKFVVYTSMTIGSIIGGYLPVFFGAGLLSYSSLIFSAIGGILGVLIGVKLSDL